MVTSLGTATVRANRPALESSRSGTPDLERALQQRDRELGAFDQVLTKLRSGLRALQDLGLEVRRPGRAASAVSDSSLDLDSADAAAVINTVANLSGISTGNFTVNGVSIAVDITADSLDDVVARINAASAGADATLDSRYDYLTVKSESVSEELVLGDDTSGFFTAVNISPTTYTHTQGDDRLKNASKIEGLFQEIGEAIDEIFNPSAEILAEELLAAVEDDVRDAIEGGFDVVLTTTSNINALRSGHGVDVDFTDPKKGVFRFDRAQFERAFRTDRTSLENFLFLGQNTGEPTGLVSRLIETLDEIGETRLEDLDPGGVLTGFFVNLRT